MAAPHLIAIFCCSVCSAVVGGFSVHSQPVDRLSRCSRCAGQRERRDLIATHSTRRVRQWYVGRGCSRVFFLTTIAAATGCTVCLHFEHTSSGAQRMGELTECLAQSLQNTLCGSTRLDSTRRSTMTSHSTRLPAPRFIERFSGPQRPCLARPGKPRSGGPPIHAALTPPRDESCAIILPRVIRTNVTLPFPRRRSRDSHVQWRPTSQSLTSTQSPPRIRPHVQSPLLVLRAMPPL